MVELLTYVMSQWEFRMAGLIAVERRLAARQEGMNANIHAAISNLNTDIDGVLGEMGYAKHRGVYYIPTVNTFKKEPDVCVRGGEYEIRATGYASGRLIIRPNDKPILHRTFVLAIVKGFRVGFAGEIVGHEAISAGEYRDGKNGEAGAWWVDQGKLHEVSGDA